MGKTKEEVIALQDAKVVTDILDKLFDPATDDSIVPEVLGQLFEPTKQTKPKPMDNKERMNGLFKEYALTKDDWFKHKHYVIITRSGIDKIQAKAKIRIEYELLHHTPDCKTAIVKAKATMGLVPIDSVIIETFGEVSPDNNKNAYPIAMAEKRAMSRAVLKLAGFYESGAFGEDEAEDFKK